MPVVAGGAASSVMFAVSTVLLRLRVKSDAVGAGPAGLLTVRRNFEVSPVATLYSEFPGALLAMLSGLGPRGWFTSGSLLSGRRRRSRWRALRAFGIPAPDRLNGVSPWN